MATEGVKGATADFVCFHCPLVASAEAKSPAYGKEPLCPEDQQLGRAHLARQCASSRKSSLGARMRTREVTGRDASLPAPLLSAFGILVARGTVGALPQTPPEAPPLDSARGRRKGTKSPLDPFRAIELFSLPYFFRVLLFCFFPYFNLSINDVAPNRSGSPSHSAHVAPISA